MLVKSDKHTLFTGLKKEVDSKLDALKQKLKLAASMDRLSRYNLKKKLADEAHKLTASVYILAQLRKDFDDTPYIQAIKKIRRSFEQERAQLAFFIVPQNKEAAQFGQKIINYLNAKGLRIKKSKNALKITLRSSMNVVYSSFNIAVIKLTIKVYDNAMLVGSADRVIKLRYNAQKENILRRAAAEFERDLKTEGLQEVLGIKLDL